MNNKSEVNYGKWTNKQLAAELKARKVKCTGKKADLVERLFQLDKLFIKSNPLEEDNYNLHLPDAKLYKDGNSSHNINLEINFDVEYLRSVQSALVNDKGRKMYEDKYLLNLRKAECNNEVFLCARVASQFRKSVIYKIDLKISSYQYLSDVQCECAAGKGPNAHCKHVYVVLNAIKDFIAHNSYKTRETCTEQLQSFHKVKKYTSSPIKSKDFQLVKNQKKLIDFDPRQEKYRKCLEYSTNFRNKCINFAATSAQTFPELQLFEAANIYALHHDHHYLKVHSEDQFLKDMGIQEISKERAEEIQVETIGQASNKLWFKNRQFRINSSSFGDVCKSTNLKSVTESLMRTVDLSHVPSIMHGRKYESHAIKKLEYLMNEKCLECGTFVSLEYPFLAASPDALLKDMDVCVEVKCPYTAKNKKISPETVPYLYLCEIEGFYKLKVEHNYFYQIQGQMFCTGKVQCLLSFIP